MNKYLMAAGIIGGFMVAIIAEIITHHLIFAAIDIIAITSLLVFMYTRKRKP